MALDALRELEREAVMGTYARQPVEFVRGEGTRLWDSDGNEYLDFLSGISVTQLGHCHPRVVEAVREQAGRLDHVGNLFYTEPAMALARRLAGSSLGGKVFFCNSGAEAIECAIKLARRRKPGGRFVVLEGAFHGRTMGALSATPQETKQAPFAPLVPGFSVAPRGGPVELDDDVAAVIIEPVQGEGGIHPVDPELLLAAREACDAHDALLVLDEIQCGMGRTGTLWAWQQLGVEPDVMTVAKGLGGGLPIGACIAAPAHADVLQPGDHGSTFAGGPVVLRGGRGGARHDRRRGLPGRGARARRAARHRAARPRAGRARDRADARLPCAGRPGARAARPAGGAPGAERDRPRHGAPAAAAQRVGGRGRRGGAPDRRPAWRDRCCCSPTAATWPPSRSRPAPSSLGPALLPGHRLALTRRSIRWGGGVVDVVPATGEQVWGVVYEAPEPAIVELDRKEGAGFAYRRRHVEVELAGEAREAMTYEVIDKETDVPPATPEYTSAGARRGPRARAAGGVARRPRLRPAR